MKYALMTCCLLANLWIYSCQTTEKKNEETPTQNAAQASIADSIVPDTVTNSQGVKLAMAFDNAARMAILVLKVKVIQLKQDTLASGIKYSNADYQYKKQQGLMTLKKMETSSSVINSSLLAGIQIVYTFNALTSKLWRSHIDFIIWEYRRM